MAAILVAWALLKRGREARANATAQLLRQHNWERLCVRYGEDAARGILNGALWVGVTADMVFEMLGTPVNIDETVMKTKTKWTFKYAPTGPNRYALRVYIEDGVVVGWEDKR